MMYGVPDLPLSGSTRDESTEVEHTMYNVFNKTICVCYYTNSSSGLLFIMCGYCYYIDPAAVRTCMQTNFTVHGQPPQFLIASAANDNKQHHVHALSSSLPNNTPVWVQTENSHVPGTVIQQASTPQSYNLLYQCSRGRLEETE